VAEKQLLAAEEQLEKLDAQMELAQQQVDALRGIDNSVMSVEAAILRLSQEIAAERQALQMIQAAQQAARLAETVSGFAAGGLHMGGLRMVGETGPELEVTGPARYFSASQTANMMGGGAEVAMEIRGLREENKAQARALVGLQSRMTRLLERWEGDGLPSERVETA